MATQGGSSWLGRYWWAVLPAALLAVAIAVAYSLFVWSEVRATDTPEEPLAPPSQTPLAEPAAPAVPAEVRLARAQAAFTRGQMQTAADELDVLLAEDPDQVEALMLRGQIFEGTSNFTEARETFIRATKVAPDNARAHELVGLAAVKLKRYDECVTAFGQVIALEPFVAANYRYRADCYELAGNSVPAKLDRDKACDLSPTDERCKPEAPAPPPAPDPSPAP